MKKKPVVVSHETQIDAAKAEYEAAVNTFTLAQSKLIASDVVLNRIDADIDAQIAALQEKKAVIAEQKERNEKFSEKLGEFLS